MILLNTIRPLMTLDEVKDEEIVLLDSLIAFCDENNLSYLVAYGTLLGAMRHRGFIPWDDDIDLVMPRDDYDRLIALWEDKPGVSLVKTPSCGKPWLFLKYVSTDTIFREEGVRHSDDHGVFIDIFPLDGVAPRFPKQYFRFVHLLNTIYDCSYAIDFSCERHSGIKAIIKKLLGYVGRAIPQRKFSNIIRYFAKRFSGTGVSEVVNYYSPYSFEKERTESSDIDSRALCSFEGRSLLTFRNPEKKLRQLYGDAWIVPLVDADHVHGVALRR